MLDACKYYMCISSSSDGLVTFLAMKKIQLVNGLVILIAASLLLMYMNLDNATSSARSNINGKGLVTSSLSVPMTATKTSCLKFSPNSEVEALIERSNQIFITMPAKAAGTSLEEFTTKCTNGFLSNNIDRKDWEVINEHAKDTKKAFLSSSLHLPPILTAHLIAGDKPLTDLIQHSTQKSLLVYIHREESDRLQSGVKQVASALVCGRARHKLGSLRHFHIEKNATHCTIDEGPLIDLIEKRTQEVGIGAPNILSCEMYNAIEMNAPRMIIMHYKQVNKLQKILAKKYCPGLVNKPVVANVAKEKLLSVLLRLQNKQGLVSIDEWLDAKSGLLEWSLNLRRNATCQATTRHMEDELFTCTDEVLMASTKEVRRWY